MKVVAADKTGIAAAVEALRAGRVVAYPTETVYGLAVDPTRAEAIERLFTCKGRSERNPVLVVVGSRGQVESVAREIPVSAELLMDCFWPGPLSLLLPRQTALPLSLTAGADQICVRWTAHPVAQALCMAFDGPLTSTSANLSGQPPVQSLSTLDLEGVSVGLDDGPLPSSKPSTVYDPVRYRVLREGAIDAGLIEKVLGR